MVSLRPVPLVRRVAGVLIALHVLGIALERLVGASRSSGVLRQLDLNAEANLTAWFGSFLLLACSAVAALVTMAVRADDAVLGRRWGVMSLLLLAMSIDESAQLHDMATGPLRRALGLELGLLHFTWLIPGIAVLVVALVYLAPVARMLDQDERTALLRATVVYVAGAVVLEMAGGLVVDVDVEVEGYTLPYLAMTTIEESLEIIGAVLLLGALLRIAGRRGPHLLLGVAADRVGERVEIARAASED